MSSMIGRLSTGLLWKHFYKHKGCPKIGARVVSFWCSYLPPVFYVWLWQCSSSIDTHSSPYLRWKPFLKYYLRFLPFHKSEVFWALSIGNITLPSPRLHYPYLWYKQPALSIPNVFMSLLPKKITFTDLNKLPLYLYCLQIGYTI